MRYKICTYSLEYFAYFSVKIFNEILYELEKRKLISYYYIFFLFFRQFTVRIIQQGSYRIGHKSLKKHFLFLNIH